MHQDMDRYICDYYKPDCMRTPHSLHILADIEEATQSIQVNKNKSPDRLILYNYYSVHKVSADKYQPQYLIALVLS